MPLPFADWIKLTDHQDETKTELYKWLDAHWTNDMYDDFVQKRLHGTCSWIFKRAEFRDWKQRIPGYAKILWVCGPPGYGKTILCAKVIQHLLEEPNDLLAYFFFSSELEGREDPFIIMRSWIAQITAQSRQAFDLVRAQWEAAEPQIASRADIVKLLVSS